MSDKYEPGDELNGCKIESVIQQNSKAIVAIVAGFSLEFEFTDIGFDATQIITKFNQLDSELSRNLPKPLLNSLVKELGAALFCALISPDLEKGLEHFDKIEQRINEYKHPEETTVTTSDKYEPGDKLNGYRIESIIQQNSKAIVAIVEGFSLEFEFTEPGFDATQIITKFNQLDSQLPRDLPNPLLSRLVKELGAALFYALTCPSLEKGLEHFGKIEQRINEYKHPEETTVTPDDKYEPGDKLNGCKIESIIHQNSKAIVAIVEGYSLQYEFTETGFDTTHIMTKFNQLDSKLSRELPKPLLRTLAQALGAALFCALTSSDSEKGLAHFDNIEERINSCKHPEEAKATLILSAFILTTSLSLILIILVKLNIFSLNTLFLCMALGACGSFFSLLQRNQTISINLLESDKYLYLQSFIIIITGIFSGLIIFIFSQADIAFGFAADEPYTLLTVSLTAGFTERLVPDLFGKVNLGS